ncbi:IPT/TIG domain-containing protein [Gaoshiqia sediminis]|uniref:IPT/TIG domain-containing protein n=1 Tax=Gaoshiqia sediminis TaxID=2986998 RepID=A0AA41Y8N8_9BACT|nr:IPT/TIG domain-containing protein [Gaoshiqia sediminis]MCW0483930.1 hypothetical protein [Gaoshiqia sediminis]
MKNSFFLKSEVLYSSIMLIFLLASCNKNDDDSSDDAPANIEITSIEPASAQVGENVVVKGVNMLSVISIKVGDLDAAFNATSDSIIEITIPQQAQLGLNTLTCVNDIETYTTSDETLKFYVIESNNELIMTFDGNDAGIYNGLADKEESTAYGTSDDQDVIANAVGLPNSIDGNFFHFEGYCSADLSGTYAATTWNSDLMSPGTYADFFSDVSLQDVYFNIQVNIGDLPQGYDGKLFGLKVRFDGDDYKFIPTVSDLAKLGGTPNEDGWYNLNIPMTSFIDDAEIGTFEMSQMQRFGVEVQRSYGTGGTNGVPLTEADGGVFYSLSFDNARLSIGGPYLFN